MPRDTEEQVLLAGSDPGLGTPDGWSRFRGRTVGVIVLASFGAYSMYGWTLEMISGGRLWWLSAIALLTTALIACAITHLVLHSRVPKPDLVGRFRRYYAIRFFLILTTEVIAIVLAGPVLGDFNRAELIPQWINIVVGIHFLPLGKLFKMPIYYATGAAIMVSSVASVLISSSSARYATNSGGTGLALWITAVIVLSADASHLRRSRSGHLLPHTLHNS